MLLESPCLFIHLYLERLLVRWMGEHESHDLRPPTGSFHIFSWTNLSSGNPSLRIEIVVFACGQIQVARLGSYTLLVGAAGSSSLALPPCNLPPLGKWVLPLACPTHPSSFWMLTVFGLICSQSTPARAVLLTRSQRSQMRPL